MIGIVLLKSAIKSWCIVIMEALEELNTIPMLPAEAVHPYMITHSIEIQNAYMYSVALEWIVSYRCSFHKNRQDLLYHMEST